MKKQTKIIILSLFLIIAAIVFLRLFWNDGEDTWIKDEKGVYVKHGNPNNTPDYVQEQQTAIEESSRIYTLKKSDGINFSSQCLGSTGDYAVDIVNVPRTTQDDLIENQCEDYFNGKVGHFIELDKQGNIVRVA